MKRSKKLKLTNTAKTILSMLIIIIVLIALSFHHKDKIVEEVHEIKEEDNYTLKIDYPVISNEDINEEITK